MFELYSISYSISTNLLTFLKVSSFSLTMDGSTDDSVTKSDREVEIESEREIQSNREGERDSEENRDESDVDSDGEIDSESVCEQ
jgi:hypothetical protein